MEPLDGKKTLEFCNDFWEKSILPALSDYIRIPAISPSFDRHWEENGELEKALQLAEQWAGEHIPPDGRIQVFREKGRTPLLLLEIPGDHPETVLIYGHLDKQPEMTGWRSDLGPWEPVRDGDLLYGRGGADDGYALFTALAAIRAVREQGRSHGRIVILVEFSEESGSPDLPHYVKLCTEQIGTPGLIICLDSGCGNFDQLWNTTSLRGILSGILSVRVLNEGVHSGDASGIVPSSFRLLRQLLSRIEDENTGRMKPLALYCEIPEMRMEQARAAARVLGEDLYARFPFPEGVRPVATDHTELVLNRTWRPTLSIVGMDGIPPCGQGGNVLRPETAIKISIRLPPTVNSCDALSAVSEILLSDPPCSARISLEPLDTANGWDAPQMATWLGEVLDESSRKYFGRRAQHMGEGGSIPFMGLLARMFPQARFVVTGVLGPGANAHGPNEFLHLPYVRKLNCCLAEILAAQAMRNE